MSKYTPEEINVIEELLRNGCTFLEISQRTGFSLDDVGEVNFGG